MKLTKKLLVTLYVTVLLATSFSGTAFAADLNQTVSQPVQKALTEATINTQTDNPQTDANVSSSDAASDVTSSDDNVIVDDQGQVYDNGALVDEQGQVYVPGSQSDDTSNNDASLEDKNAASDDTKGNGKSDDKKDTTDVKKPTYSESDLRLLSCLVYSEAGNQSYEGMLAVANVVLNRVKSDVFWHVKTIKEVIYDHKWSVQFAVTIKDKSTGMSPMDRALKLYDTRKTSGSNPEAQKKSMEKAIKAAKAALEGENNIGNYLCFQNKRYTTSIRKKYPDYKIIGDHLFYRTK
ncbi:MAG TPA: cell wall hydrolase [Mobilitalea sp.]|nr:cell wall hydrolase [Mobilitalea sp.]